PPVARYRSSGSPTIHASPTRRRAGSRTAKRVPRVALQRTRVSCLIAYSSSRSLCQSGLIAHHSNEQVGDAGRAHVAECGKLLAIDTLIDPAIEQQDAVAERLALVYRLQRPCRAELLGMHRHLHIARLELFHAAIEHHTAAVDEHEICEYVLKFLYLVCRHDNRAAAIEVVVQQGIVELLAKQDVKAKCRLVQHEQSRVNGHDESEVQLG